MNRKLCFVWSMLATQHTDGGGGYDDDDGGT